MATETKDDVRAKANAYAIELRRAYMNPSVVVAWDKDRGYFVQTPKALRFGGNTPDGWDRWSVDRDGSAKWSTPETRQLSGEMIGERTPAKLFAESDAKGTVENPESVHDGMPALTAAGVGPVYFKEPRPLSVVRVPELGPKAKPPKFAVLGVLRDAPNLVVSVLSWRSTKAAITEAFNEACASAIMNNHEPRIWIVGEDTTHRTIPGDW